MVCSDSHCAPELLALEHEGSEDFLDVIQLSLVVLRVFVSDLLKALPAIRKVSWIDANLVKRICNLQRNLGSKVNVRHQRGCVSFLQQSLLDLAACIGFTLPLHGQADKLGSCVSASHDLVDTSLNVSRHRRRHRLQGDRMFTADGDVSALDGSCLAPGGLVHRVAVAQQLLRLLHPLLHGIGRHGQGAFLLSPAASHRESIRAGIQRRGESECHGGLQVSCSNDKQANCRCG
mmetsp:Transcript_45727/g.143514  ORF Transcript_45727/g.143514 Transcript_45727/m.143514 type:complete len:233 (-) Transcript_45727:82-780(-)